MTNEYEQQAAAFLQKTGATLEARLLKTGFYFGEDKDQRDIYEVRLTRGAREYIFTFGVSINDTEERIGKVLRGGANYNPYNVKAFLAGNYTPDWMEKGKLKKQEAELKEWAPAGTGNRPTAYDILASLDGYEPPQDVDEFAADFGYTKPSQAIKVFNSVHDQYKNLKMLFSDSEMEALQEIN